ncbi:MAG: tRNA (N(6)-L-threonylcarbamoyladenosine(37)-C(2))-methylthiotransferase MtaB [Lachnospiraceae bacterium]|nr:tRNA (N(6)-L-threonylcarbamoyladenosine(37)-C(2))-methylthiotransferase MtaB [Lachnospiraceae bacterium]
MTKRKAAFHTLGCKVNAYETEAMAEALLRGGYEIVPFEPGADVYIINTCTVTNIADRKSRQMLHKAKELNPGAAIVAAGCYAEDARERLIADPDVDLVVGNTEKAAICQILDRYFLGEKAEERVPIAHSASYDDLFVTETDGKTRAYLKIQDGCNQFCSYCMIPYVRGRVRSRRKESIMEEAKRLTEAGYREIVLTGIHISSYGIDFRHPGENLQTPYATEAETNEDLLNLIMSLDALPGLVRLRLGSLEPGIMTREFVEKLSGIPSICPQFHLSLQSGCDDTLRRMKRKYDTASYEKIVTSLREHFQNPSITTDVITGFPGEDEREFAESRAFVEKIHFARTHIFPYSLRNGTKAAAMPNQNTNAVKHDRLVILENVDTRERRSYAESFVGRPVEVLFEEPRQVNGKMYMMGHTREYITAYKSDPADLSGQIQTRTGVRALDDGSLIVD